MTLATDIEKLEIATLGKTLPRPAGVSRGLTGLPKRLFDLILATLVLIFTLPFMLLIALLIRLQDNGPVFFKHARCGRGGVSFMCYKFRTMKLNAQETLDSVLQQDPLAAEEWARDQKLRNDPRVTWLGRFLRKSSLDELPQLLNILQGDMSIIGPRPVTYGELPRYGTGIVYYSAARPGVTGLWQVNGRNTLTYEQRIAYDTQYVKEWTMLGDLHILAKTIPAVLFSKGAF